MQTETNAHATAKATRSRAIRAHRAAWRKRTQAEQEARIIELDDAFDAATEEAERTDNWDRVCEIEWELIALGWEGR